ncbi:hypothetical protein [Streptomyces sp. NPDC007172]|uniref:hypothetical protein n=1 Tax=Streptomyces sp. NPDC007172 TaxID=3364776 RepID=UPI0036A2B1B3
MTTPMAHHPMGPPQEFSHATTDMLRRLAAGVEAYESPAERAERAHLTRRRLDQAVRTLALVPSHTPDRRPGWQRVERLSQDRQIGMLLDDSADILVPPEETRDLGWDRQRTETWLKAWGIRLVCLSVSAPPDGGEAP